MISKAAIPDFHALLVRDLREPHFDPHWHHHPEYQLSVVLEGTGTRFVGDGVSDSGRYTVYVFEQKIPCESADNKTPDTMSLADSCHGFHKRPEPVNANSMAVDNQACLHAASFSSYSILAASRLCDAAEATRSA